MEILNLLEISQDQWSVAVYKGGISYLENILPVDAQLRHHLEGDSAFWAWWQACWAEVDSAFVKIDHCKQSISQMRVIWSEIHQAAAVQQRPFSMIIERHKKSLA